MMRRMTAALLFAVVATSGCDKLAKVPVVGKYFAKADTSKAPSKAAPAKAAPPTTAAAPTKTPADTKAPAETTHKAPVHLAAAPAPAPAPMVTTAQDQPWTPKDTGTVKPGMSKDQVAGVWGKPETERTAGRWTYLYFRNGCEFSCGTFDLVVLDNGQVVDAVVRGHGHTYSGVSSSPSTRAPKFTPPVHDTGRGGS